MLFLFILLQEKFQIDFQDQISFCPLKYLTLKPTYHQHIIYPIQDITTFKIFKLTNEKQGLCTNNIQTAIVFKNTPLLNSRHLSTKNTECVRKSIIEDVVLDHNFIHSNVTTTDMSYTDFHYDTSSNHVESDDENDGFYIPPTPESTKLLPTSDSTTINFHLAIQNLYQQYNRPSFIRLWDYLLQMNWFKAHDRKSKTAKLSSAGYIEYFCAPWAKCIKGAFVTSTSKKPCDIIVDILKLQENVDYFERHNLIDLIPKCGYERNNYVKNKQDSIRIGRKRNCDTI